MSKFGGQGQHRPRKVHSMPEAVLNGGGSWGPLKSHAWNRMCYIYLLADLTAGVYFNFYNIFVSKAACGTAVLK